MTGSHWSPFLPTLQSAGAGDWSDWCLSNADQECRHGQGLQLWAILNQLLMHPPLTCLENWKTCANLPEARQFAIKESPEVIVASV